MLYFGYGSNLCATDLAGWCTRRGLDPLALESAGPAFLPDRRLAFTHHSTTRGGGVLDVPEAAGSAVAGIVFSLPGPKAGATLDRKESEGHVYRRFETVALTEDGGETPVFAYEVEPSRREAFVTPAPLYLEVVRAGYREHGVSAAALDSAAQGAPHPGPVTNLFVYGTLLPGEERYPILARHRVTGGAAASIVGTLLDLGPYPGLVLDGTSSTVAGALYAAPDPEALIRELDPTETFLGFGAQGSLYRRAIVRVDTGGANSTLAWTYLYAGAPSGARAIASGDWRGRHRA